MRQIAVRGGNNPQVGVDGLVSAQPHEAMVLQETKEFGLNQGYHVAEIIVEEHATAGLLKLPDPHPFGPGEGPFLMAGQFAFQRSFGNRRSQIAVSQSMSRELVKMGRDQGAIGSKSTQSPVG